MGVTTNAASALRSMMRRGASSVKRGCQQAATGEWGARHQDACAADVSTHSTSSVGSQPLFDISIHDGVPCGWEGEVQHQQHTAARSAVGGGDEPSTSMRRRAAAAAARANPAADASFCAQQVATLLAPTTLFEAQLSEDAHLALARLGPLTAGGTLERLARLALALRQLGGHRVVLRRVADAGHYWAADSAFLVVLDTAAAAQRLHVEYIVDPSFRESFTTASMSPAYSAVVRGLPSVFVGQPCCLPPLVALLAGECELSFMEVGHACPPWRNAPVMLARWMSDSCNDVVVPTMGASTQAVAAFMAAATAPLVGSGPANPLTALEAGSKPGDALVPHAPPACSSLHSSSGVRAIKSPAGVQPLRSQRGFEEAVAAAAAAAARGASRSSSSSSNMVDSNTSSMSSTRMSTTGGGESGGPRSPSAAAVLAAVLEACTSRYGAAGGAAAAAPPGAGSLEEEEDRISSAGSILYDSGSLHGSLDGGSAAAAAADEDDCALSGHTLGGAGFGTSRMAVPARPLACPPAWLHSEPVGRCASVPCAAQSYDSTGAPVQRCRSLLTAQLAELGHRSGHRSGQSLAPHREDAGAWSPLMRPWTQDMLLHGSHSSGAHAQLIAAPALPSLAPPPQPQLRRLIPQDQLFGGR